MIDSLGNIVVPVSYDQIGFFSEGICPVCVKDNTHNCSQKIWGFINEKHSHPIGKEKVERWYVPSHPHARSQESKIFGRVFLPLNASGRIFRL